MPDDHAPQLTSAPQDEPATTPPAANAKASPTTASWKGPSPEETTPPAPGLGDGTDAGPARASVPGYEILGELGRGGMGVVYRARQVALNRACALKMILTGGHAGEDERGRFLAKAEAIARVRHPGIVQVYDFGTHEGLAYFSLELCEGGTLAGRLRDGPLPPREAAAVLEKIARAVQGAHEAGVVHRDLKPGNVLLAEDGSPRVTDFGLAKRIEGGGNTRTGAVMGTPSYMAPEQAEGKKEVGPAADVWALGAVLYECLSGRPPFRAATTLDTILRVTADEPVPLRQLNAAVPVDLETIAHRCVQKDPKKRHASSQELADDLGRYLAGEPIQARPVGVVERAVKWVRRNRVLSIAAALVLLTLTAGVVVSSFYARLASEEASTARKAEGDARPAANQAQEQKARADGEAKAARKAEAEAKEREKAEAVAKQQAEDSAKSAKEQRAQAEENLHKAEWSIYAGKLLLAQAAFNENNVSDAFWHLEECQWDLRGWEHAHLRMRFDPSKQTLKGHTGIVSSVAWSPDGKRILTASWDRTAKVWDVEKGQEVLALEGHPGCAQRGLDSRRQQSVQQEPRWQDLAWDLVTEHLLSDPAATLSQGQGREANSLDANAHARIDGKVIRMELGPDCLVPRKRRQAETRARLEQMARFDPTWHSTQARSAEEAGEDFAASFHLELLARRHPWGAEVHVRLAHLRSHARQREHAARHSNKAHGKGGFPITWLFRSIALCNLGRFDESAKLLDQVKAWHAKQNFTNWQQREAWAALLREAEAPPLMPRLSDTR